MTSGDDREVNVGAGQDVPGFLHLGKPAKPRHNWSTRPSIVRLRSVHGSISERFQRVRSFREKIHFFEKSLEPFKSLRILVMQVQIPLI